MSDKITFKELVEKISAKTDQSEQSTNDFIHELAEIIEQSLGAGEKISISGFGKFELRWVDERQGRHPQTGEEITIPGQNKVVFKPYKALRERVNKPFRNLESRVIGDDQSDSKKAPDSSSGLSPSATPGHHSAANSLNEKSEQTEEDLLVERDVPEDVSQSRSGQKENPAAESDYKPYLATNKTEPVTGPAGTDGSESEEEEDDLAWVFDQKMQHQEELTQDVQTKGSLNWTYAAAAVVVILAFFLIFFVITRQDDPVTQDAPSLSDQPAIAQVESSRQNAASAERDATGAVQQGDNEGTQQQQVTSGSDTDSPGSDAARSAPTQTADDALDMISHKVETGESLWSIAEATYGDPFLWPVIYSANGPKLDNPNQLAAGNSLKLPVFGNPGQLTESERKKVALGYISVYDWISQNQPTNARYFLWAAGSYSQEVLRDASDNVNEADLAFATQG